MIVKLGNIFDSKCNTIVNTVNCVGVMGKGIALEFNEYSGAAEPLFRKSGNRLSGIGNRHVA